MLGRVMSMNSDEHPPFGNAVHCTGKRHQILSHPIVSSQTGRHTLRTQRRMERTGPVCALTSYMSNVFFRIFAENKMVNNAFSKLVCVVAP